MARGFVPWLWSVSRRCSRSCAARPPAETRARAASGPQDGGACIGPGCGGGGSSGSGGSGGLPPEQEAESSFRSPVATGKYVWATNPSSGRVALIDSTTLAVHTQAAGNGPTYLAALDDPAHPDTARAIVIDVKSHDATILSADSKGHITTASVPVHQDANSLAISKTARFAIAWTDATQVPNADTTQGFQDVTVVDVGASPPVATRLSVGYRPTRVFISDDASQAFVVAEPGITVIALTDPAGPSVVMDVPVTDDPLDNPASRDVTVTPDGKYALVRRDGSPEVGIVSLSDGTIVTVKLSGAVTDLDLSDDGSRAIAVVREPGVVQGGDAGSDAATSDGAAGSAGAAGSDAGAAATEASAGSAGTAAGAAGAAGAPGTDAGTAGATGTAGSDAGTAGAPGTDAGTAGASDGGSPEAAPPPPPSPPTSSDVFLLPIPGIFTAPDVFDAVTIDHEIVGSVSVSQEGGVALLYTNAYANDHLTLLTTAAGSHYLEHRTVALKAPVKAVFPTPDGAHAIALLTPGAGSNKAGAFSLVPVAADLPPKILGTDAPPVAVAIAPAPSTRALVTVRDDAKKIFVTYLARMPELQVDAYPLASPPLATGLVPASGEGYVAQEHPEGRVTFITLQSGSARTLTGFELGAKVVDGSQ